MNPAKITADTIRGMKARGEKIAALTAYDYPTTKLLGDRCGRNSLLRHLGMLPQHVREEGGYKIKGRNEAEHQH
jgi:ketopantoate hydroxymethyltransferase